MLSVKLIYLVLFGGYGALIPFLSVFYRAQGMSTSYIGVLGAVTPAVGFFAGPVWGMVADRNRIHKPMLMWTTLATLVATQLQWVVAPHHTAIAVLVVTAALFSAPGTPLIENAVITLAERSGDNYGKNRLWGAVGFGITSLLGGVLISHVGYGGAFAVYTLLGLVSLVMIVKGLPMGDPKPAPGDSAGGQPPDVIAGFKVLVSTFEALSFFVIVYILGIVSGILEQFMFVWLVEIGGTGTLMGVSRFITCAAEVPFFHFSQQLIDRVGVNGVLAMACVCYVLRFLYYAHLTTPWAVLPAELLHGVTFAAMWAASVSKAHQLAPEGMGATAQGLLEGVHWKLGMCTGSLLGGFLYERVGAVRTFETAAMVSAFALVLLAAAPALGRRLGWAVTDSRAYTGVRGNEPNDADAGGDERDRVELPTMGTDPRPVLPVLVPHHDADGEECFDI